MPKARLADKRHLSGGVLLYPRDCLRGKGLLQIQPWNSVFFTELTKSRVQENQFRIFYCPRLARKGVRRVADCLNMVG